MIELLLRALLYILPAYATNGSAVLFKGKTPIDQGAKFLDGRPLLGKGKTVKGFVFAAILGTSVGCVQAFFAGDPSLIYLGFLLSVGAMVGDSAGSFIKRRFNLKRGEAAPLLDQWDFVFGALAFAWLGTLYGIAFPPTEIVLAILVMTVFLHLGANYAAYLLKMKKEPW